MISWPCHIWVKDWATYQRQGPEPCSKISTSQAGIQAQIRTALPVGSACFTSANKSLQSVNPLHFGLLFGCHSLTKNCVLTVFKEEVLHTTCQCYCSSSGRGHVLQGPQPHSDCRLTFSHGSCTHAQKSRPRRRERRVPLPVLPLSAETGSPWGRVAGPWRAWGGI